MNFAPNTADSYKTGHHDQYPKGTTEVYSNFTPRTDHHANVNRAYYDGRVVFFGLQGVIKKYLLETWNMTFFWREKEDVCAQYKRRVSNLLGKDFDVSHFEALHDLGYLPIEIKAFEEGTLVPIKVPVFTIHNTLPEFFWLTNYLETALSTEMWKQINNATIAYNFRAILTHWSKKTGSPDFMIPWQGHDFSLRGMSGLEDGAASGVAHLTSFSGTDNLIGIDYAEDYYGADSDKQIVGGSVPATEHSVMCMGGDEGEFEIIERLIDDNPDGILSLVLDGYDYYRAINEYLPRLKDKILARNGKLVVRPDSGDPADIICGSAKVIPMTGTQETLRDIYSDLWFGPSESVFALKEKVGVSYLRLESSYIRGDGVRDFVPTAIISPTLEQRGSFEILWEHFGGTVNEKGYRVLNDKIGLIYGDSITPARAEDILSRLAAKGYASTPVFGMGSYLYQYNTRDSFGMAMKATHGVINGVGVNIFKDPKTGDGSKKSLTGYIRVVDIDGVYVAQDRQKDPHGGVLTTVFKDGKLVRETTLSEIRKKLHNWDDAIPA